MDLEEQIRSLRKRKEEAERKRSMLAGRKAQREEQLRELQERVKTSFGCSLKELPALLAQTEAEYQQELETFEAKLEEAERLLAEYE